MTEIIYWDVAMTEGYVPTTKYFVGIEEDDSGETWISRPHPRDLDRAYDNSVRRLAGSDFIRVYRECCPEEHINHYTIFETEKYDKEGQLLRPFCPVLHVFMTPYHARGYFVSEHEILSGFKVIDDQKRKVSTILGKDHHAWWNYSLASHEIVGVRGVKPERYAYALGGQFRYAILDGAETLAVAASGKWKAFTPAARPLLFPSSQQDRRRVPEQPAR